MLRSCWLLQIIPKNKLAQSVRANTQGAIYKTKDIFKKINLLEGFQSPFALCTELIIILFLLKIAQKVTLEGVIHFIYSLLAFHLRQYSYSGLIQP